MKVGFICVNYNNTLVTKKLIDSIVDSFNFENNDLEIVIIDNSNNIILDTNSYPFKINIVNCDNIGYFPGLNVGLIFLKKQLDFDFIIIGNNDLIFNNLFWENLDLNKESLKNHFVIAPRILKENGEEQNPHVINDLSKLRLKYLKLIYTNRYFYKYIRLIIQYIIPNKYRRKDELNFNVSQYILQGHGSCYILTQKYFEKHNLPEYTILYGEEYFLSYQLKQLGTSVYFFHEISVYHNEHSSTNKLISKELFKIKKNAFVKEMSLRKTMNNI
jgi:GT2 family glycosyltransferase